MSNRALRVSIPKQMMHKLHYESIEENISVQRYVIKLLEYGLEHSDEIDFKD